jgi:hypothetical protein
MSLARPFASPPCPGPAHCETARPGSSAPPGMPPDSVPPATGIAGGSPLGLTSWLGYHTPQPPGQTTRSGRLRLADFATRAVPAGRRSCTIAAGTRAPPRLQGGRCPTRNRSPRGHGVTGPSGEPRERGGSVVLVDLQGLSREHQAQRMGRPAPWWGQVARYRHCGTKRDRSVSNICRLAVHKNGFGS